MSALPLPAVPWELLTVFCLGFMFVVNVPSGKKKKIASLGSTVKSRYLGSVL